MSRWAAIAKVAKQKTRPVQKGQKGSESPSRSPCSDFLHLSDLSAPGSLSEIPVPGAKIGPNGQPGSKPEKLEDKKPSVLPTVSSPQTSQDWRDLFEERAAIAEYDGGLTRNVAEARAFECCVSEWLNNHPPAASPDTQCARCGGQLGDHDSIPIARPDGGATWLHDACHEPWMEERRRQAEADAR